MARKKKIKEVVESSVEESIQELEPTEKVVSATEVYEQAAAQVVVELESVEVKPKHKPDAVPTVPFYFVKR